MIHTIEPDLVAWVAGEATPPSGWARHVRLVRNGLQGDSCRSMDPKSGLGRLALCKRSPRGSIRAYGSEGTAITTTMEENQAARQLS